MNWAPISDGAANGGGVNGYCQQLALELVAKGHDVFYIASGQTYLPEHATPGAGAVGPCRVRRHGDWRGVRVFEIMNSPVVSPGPCQFSDPEGEIRSEAVEAEFGRLLAIIEPDVVHFQNIEGLSAGCVAVARGPLPSGRRARVVFSLHNYHTICPQVYLMQHGRVPCRSFDAGHACVGCVSLPPAEHERARRGEEYRRHHAPPVPPAVSTPEPTGALGKLFGGGAKPVPVPVHALPWPGRAVETFADTVPEKSERSRSLRVVQGPDMDGPEWQPLSNEVVPEPSSSKDANGYAHRRAAMVSALSSCDAVLAVSDFVRRKFESMGVSGAVIRTLTIGSRMTALAEDASEVLVPPPPLTPHRPIRLAFLGYHNFYKGLHMLVDALELLTPEYLSRFDLYVSAKAIESIESRLLRLRARLGGLTIERGYAYGDVPALLAGRDLGVVPSVWWDNGPQTVMEFLACGVPVLGAELGGIPDLVRHNENGLLFRGNDRFHLASTLASLARNPGQLTGLRARVRAPKSMATHGNEIEQLYRDLLARG